MCAELREAGNVCSEDNSNSYRHRILKVLLHIEERIYENRMSEKCEEPITLEELADVAGFSPFHFHRIFSGMVGETVKAYVRRIKMDFAAYHLSYSRIPIAQIALGSGYESQESFSRAFKVHFGVSPAAYRKAAPERPYYDTNRIGERIMFETSEFSLERLGLTVEVKTIPAIRVASVRHVGPYAECGKAWEKLCAWAGPKGLLAPEAQYFGVCHDDPQVTPADKIRFDASVTVGPEVEGEGEVFISEIPGGDHAVAVHTGPYDTLCKAYAAICGQWGPTSGREFAAAPSVEQYLSDPKTTPPEETKTEIRLPLK